MSLRIYYVYKTSIPNTCRPCQRKQEVQQEQPKKKKRWYDNVLDSVF